MASIISNFPARQKLLLVLTIMAGFFIWFCYRTNTLSHDRINTIIFIYSFSVPVLILGFPTIMDLNDNKIFFVWLVFSILLLLISVFTSNLDTFLIHRSEKFDETSGINSLMADHSTSALKSLFFFLIVYWVLNLLLKKLTGNFIINTFKQNSWVHPETKRKITALDVLSNFILLVTVLYCVLF